MVTIIMTKNDRPTIDKLSLNAVEQQFYVMVMEKISKQTPLM